VVKPVSKYVLAKFVAAIPEDIVATTEPPLSLSTFTESTAGFAIPFAFQVRRAPVPDGVAVILGYA
jgi:hypothetical protein